MVRGSHQGKKGKGAPGRPFKIMAFGNYFFTRVQL